MTEMIFKDKYVPEVFVDSHPKCPILVMRYSIDRDFPVSRAYKILIVITSASIFTIATIVTWAASGYETVMVHSSDFNGTKWIWYDLFVPSQLRTPHRNCSAGEINLNDCIHF